MFYNDAGLSKETVIWCRVTCAASKGSCMTQFKIDIIYSLTSSGARNIVTLRKKNYLRSALIKVLIDGNATHSYLDKMFSLYIEYTKLCLKDHFKTMLQFLG